MTRAATPARVVTFGEVLLRLSSPATERLFQSPSLRTFWGGAEANVAVGVASVGGDSTHVTMLPANDVGAAARRAMMAEGVDMRFALTSAGRMGLYFLESGADIRALAVTYDRAGSTFASLDGDEFDWPAILTGARWFHVSGVSAALGEGPLRAIHAALDAAKSLGVSVSLDLNYRPALWAGRDPLPVMDELAHRAQLLIGNPGAIDIMLGCRTAGTAPEAAVAILDTTRSLNVQYGCDMIAVTQRDTISASVHGWQAHLYDAESDVLHTARRYEVSLVDRVGGGDAFAAALLVELTRTTGPASAIAFATAAGALKLTVPGDFSRFSRADVERLLPSTR